MIYQADTLLTMDGPPVPGGWIRVDSDRITAVGTAENLPMDEEVRRFSGATLMPGLINAHCHLELTSMRHRLHARQSFPAWVGELRSLTGSMESADYQDSARDGVADLLRGGATTVVDVGNTGDALPVLFESPLRSFALVETLGLNPDLADSRFDHAKSLAALHPPTFRFHPGIAPHAAYSCSPKLLNLVKNHQASMSLPFTIHACESQEEADLFASASGPLQQFCRNIFPGSPEHRDTTPIRWLESQSLLPDRALIVHGNHLDETDLEILLRHKATVVHCPSSHAFFGHKPFPYPDLRKGGIPVCLGTDSLASGDSLSMLEQMKLFRKNFPEVSFEETLRMTTVVAAEALGLGNELGKLKVGYKADFIVVHEDTHVSLSVIDGVDAH